MALDRKQRDVLRGMAIGAACSIAALAGAAAWHPVALLPSNNTVAGLAFALKWALLPASCLLLAVGILARHRFFSPEDIDSGGLSVGTPRAHILQSVLQNTLEQSVLATLAYLIWAVSMPHEWLASIPAAACLFLAGRFLFYRGYEHGAGTRALGFALTFYPSVLMLASSALMLAYAFVAG